MPLTKFVGFHDEIGDTIIMPGHSRLETDYINSIEIERTWQKIKSLNSSVIKLIIVLRSTDNYPSTVPKDIMTNP